MKKLIVCLLFVPCLVVVGQGTYGQGSYNVDSATSVLYSNGVALLRSNLVSTLTGGNARGLRATDLQVLRAANTAVASGINSVILGGTNNTASGLNSMVLGGADNTSSGTSSAVIGDGCIASGDYSIAMGWDNTATEALAIAIGGTDNNALGVNTHIVGSDNSSIDADSSDCSIFGADQARIILSAFSTIIGGTINTNNGANYAFIAGDHNVNVAHGAKIIGSSIGATSPYVVYLGFTTANATQVKTNGDVAVARVLSATSLTSSDSGGISLQTNSTAPNNTSIIRAWVSVTNGSTVFKMPLYQ